MVVKILCKEVYIVSNNVDEIRSLSENKYFLEEYKKALKNDRTSFIYKQVQYDLKDNASEQVQYDLKDNASDKNSTCCLIEKNENVSLSEGIKSNFSYLTMILILIINSGFKSGKKMSAKRKS